MGYLRTINADCEKSLQTRHCRQPSTASEVDCKARWGIRAMSKAALGDGPLQNSSTHRDKSKSKSKNSQTPSSAIPAGIMCYISTTKPAIARYRQRHKQSQRSSLTFNAQD